MTWLVEWVITEFKPCKHPCQRPGCFLLPDHDGQTPSQRGIACPVQPVYCSSGAGEGQFPQILHACIKWSPHLTNYVNVEFQRYAKELGNYLMSYKYTWLLLCSDLQEASFQVSFWHMLHDQGDLPWNVKVVPIFMIWSHQPCSCLWWCHVEISRLGGGIEMLWPPPGGTLAYLWERHRCVVFLLPPLWSHEVDTTLPSPRWQTVPSPVGPQFCVGGNYGQYNWRWVQMYTRKMYMERRIPSDCLT